MNGTARTALTTERRSIGLQSLGSRSKREIIDSLLKATGSSAALDATQVVSRQATQTGAIGSNWDLVRLAVLALQGKSIEALALCHAIVRAQPGATTPVDVEDLQTVLENELLCPDMELVAQDIRFHLIHREPVLIGRPSKSSDVDVAINCGWFSRGERSLLLRRAAGNLTLTDAGSSNGSFIGQKALMPDVGYVLPLGLTTVEIGRSEDQRAPVVLHVQKQLLGAVVLSVSVGAGFQKDGRHTWPSMEEDLRMRWLIFDSEFELRATDFVLRGEAEAEQGALLSYKDGYWIAPLSSGFLKLNGIEIHSPIPLPTNAVVDASGWSLRTAPVIKAR